MDFKTRRIRKEPRIKLHRPIFRRNIFKQSTSSFNTSPFNEPDPSTSSPFATSPAPKGKIRLSAKAGAVIAIVLLFLGIYTIAKSLDFSSIVFSFGQPLATDERGNTNILLIGVGDKDHDGTDLTDTLIVASIDERKKIISMLSIPRDFYIEKGDYSQTRINAVYYTGKHQKSDAEGIEALKGIVTEVTGIPIQYHVKVNFSGFVNIVDSLEGVDILVENAIYDPYYPKAETIEYETFQIDAGPQHLDGETALKYARSRKTTSDFDRAKRQQELLYAIRDKGLKLNILTDAGKIKNLYNSIGNSISTDLTLPEIIELGKFAKDIRQSDLFPIVINDDPTTCGGLVYTPAREYFSGASVLLPVGDGYEYTKFFTTHVLRNIESIRQQDQIQVLNGTKVSGLAYEGMNILSRFCMNVVYYGNATNRELETSTIYYIPDEEGNKPKILDMVQTLIPGATVQEGIPPEYLESEKSSNTTIAVELGKEYLSTRLRDPFDNLRLFTPPETQETAEQSGQRNEVELRPLPQEPPTP